MEAVSWESVAMLLLKFMLEGAGEKALFYLIIKQTV